MSDRPLRIAAVGDLHCTKESAGLLRPLFQQAETICDVLLLCGDLTDYGTAEEAQILAKELSVLKHPIIGVLGNHDHESGTPEKVTQILSEAGVRMLDGDSVVIGEVGFAGVKGFCGGFGRGTLGPWGESAVKSFVKEALDEALKLESALARLRTQQRVALLHYAPIAETVVGEPEQIYPFLGCSRLEDPLERYPVSVCFHGHAHRGTMEGKTRHGIPVYNCAYPLMRRLMGESPGSIPLRIVELSPAMTTMTAAAE